METQATKATRILVPVDGSDLAEQAIAYASALAGPSSKLFLLRVVPHAEAIKSIWGGVVATEAQVEGMSAEAAQQDLERAASVVKCDCTVETEIVTGDPADQIIQTSLRHHVEFIVMASHGRGAVGRWTFGSVADRVARESLVPVMIICPNLNEDTEAAIERVVVSLDGSDLAARALPVAVRIARLRSIPVHLVRVISPATALYPSIALSAPVSDEAYQSAFVNEQFDAEATLSDAAKDVKARGLTVTTELAIGPTVLNIENALQPGDVIVITSHGRGGLRRWLLGSVAERLIRNGKAPVVLVPSAERQAVAEKERVEGFAFAPSQI